MCRQHYGFRDKPFRVHHVSRGIPRLINIVCERTLLVGYVEEEQVLKAPHVD